MLTIITGEIDSGKTTLLQSLYRACGRGGGIALPKYYVNHEYIGQCVVELSTGRSMLFALKGPFLPCGWIERARIQDYSFSVDGLAFAQNALINVLCKHNSPVFMDEIGPLELKQQGFYHIFSGLLLQQDRELFVCVRSCCLQDVLKLFNIHCYQSITTHR